MHSPTPDYEDIDTVHKTLLHWLVVATYIHSCNIRSYNDMAANYAGNHYCSTLSVQCT